MINMLFGLELWIYALGIYMLRSKAFVTPNPWKILWIKYNLDAMMNSVYEREEENAYMKKVEPSK